MLENREISCTSWSKDQDRSAEAMNRTADVNVQEKSDYAVVPVNRPNKEARASAEVGEGRAQTKENIVQSHKPPTQSGKGLSQGLHGVRRAASVRKQERFTTLLHHLSVALCKQNIWIALTTLKLKRKRAAIANHFYADELTHVEPSRFAKCRKRQPHLEIAKETHRRLSQSQTSYLVSKRGLPLLA